MLLMEKQLKLLQYVTLKKICDIFNLEADNLTGDHICKRPSGPNIGEKVLGGEMKKKIR